MNTFQDFIWFCRDASEYTVEYNGQPAEYVDNEATVEPGWSRWYVARRSYTSTPIVIHIKGEYGDAWEAFLDLLPTVEGDELLEAYVDGHKRDDGSFFEAARDAWHEANPDAPRTDWDAVRSLARQALEACDEPELVDGYDYNSSGGVVRVDHTATLDEADLSRITVRRKEGAA